MTNLREQTGLRGKVILVRIKASEQAKEDLTIQAERRRRRIQLDNLRHLLQLVAERRIWEASRKRRISV